MEQDKQALLFTALSELQGELQAVKKESENPFFKSKYADLSAVWDSCRALLKKHGLCIIQAPKLIDGLFVLETTLAHKQGGLVTSQLPLTFGDKATPQAMGSAITYMRRYGMQAILGVSAEDDDGNAAEAHYRAPQKQLSQSQQGQETTKSEITEYVVTFGKFKGRRLVSIPRTERDQYAEFVGRDPNDISAPARRFIEMNAAINKIEDSDDIKF